MGNLSKFSVKKPITILMSVLIIIILGVVSLTSLKTDLLPSMNIPYAMVTTTYIGASPEQIEMGLTKPLESQLATVSNIKNIRSVSSENLSLVILEFNEATNMDSAMIEMREKLDMIKGYLPDDVGNPTIIKINPNMLPIMAFSLSFEGKDISEATDIINNNILPRIERIPGVASVTVSGAAKNELQVLIDSTKVYQVNLTLPQDKQLTKANISELLKKQNFSMPAGYLTESGLDYLVRVGDKIEDIEDLKELPIVMNEGNVIRLKDIATVSFINAAEKTYSKVNGELAITLTIQKQNNFATTDVAADINKELANIQSTMTGTEVIMLLDQAEYINLSLNSVTNNLLIGGLLAIIILLIFLRDIKPTIVIALAIPISVMAAFILIYFSGITLNVISMGGLALGVGMLVDNAIVVIENTYRLRKDGASAKEAAIKGASQVAGAITASTLTTIAVFLPIVFLEGLVAQVFKEMALTITYSLIASLAIALSVIPSLTSKMMVKDTVEKETKVLNKVKKGYTKWLKFSLRHKVLTLFTSIVILAVSAFLSIRVGTEFFPASEMNQMTVNVELPKGTRFEDTATALDSVVAKIMTIEEIEYVGAQIGGGPMSFGGGHDSGTINIILSEDSTKTNNQVANEIKELTKEFEYEISIEDQGMNMSSFGGTGIQVEIKGQDLTTLEEIANDIADIISSVEGTTEVENGISKTSPEIKITVDKAKSIEYGLTVTDVYGYIAYLLMEEKAVTNISIDGREHDIRLASSMNYTVDINFIKNLPIQTEYGPVLLSQIATVEETQGYGSINRSNQSRMVTVSASIAEGYNVGKVGQKVADEIAKYQAPNGFIVEVKGEQEQISSAIRDLTLALILAVVLIYMIMAAQFESLLFPFIVMFTIPLAFTGGFIGLYITQTPISMVAFIGLIILTGIVVNNGIVLVDYINQLRAEGKSSYDAIIEAGNTRLRPILMTALTTILGLSTMALGIGEGAETLQPMAITTIGGLFYATILTLVVVPVIYSLFDRKKNDVKANE